jgi:Glyoxalase-like domain
MGVYDALWIADCIVTRLLTVRPIQSRTMRIPGAEGRLHLMASRISELVLDCRDPEALAQFWCEVLDFVVLDRDDGSVEIGPRRGFGGPQPTIILSRTDEPKKAKSRLHIDVNATDRDQSDELERLLKLGALPTDVGQTGQASWQVLADPEGNEFCLLKARLDPL